MLTTDIDYLDGQFTVSESEPSTVAELTALIGEQGVVEDAVANLRYRNKYPRVYKAVSKALSSRGFVRPVKEIKKASDGTDKTIYVSEMDHARAAISGVKDKDGNIIVAPLDNAITILQELFNTHGQNEPIYVKGERAGGAGKISQAALDASNGFFAAGEGRVESVIEKIEARVPGYKVGRDSDGAATPESVARGVQALNKQLLKESQQAALGVLA